MDEVVDRLNEVYDNREEAKRRGLAAAEAMLNWTWEKKIRRSVKELHLG